VELRLWAHRSAEVGRRKRGWTVFVQDNGLGIPESAWESVFLDFHRLDRLDVGGQANADAGRVVRGSGLGLALCRRIMAAHGGWIRVVSSSPAGTTMAFGFP
jgi:two-component system, OmpR family, sensor histidine kinase SenX3